MSLLKEFKEFAVKGNVVDMAVGVIVGAAFGKVVTSFVNDVIMPPLGLLIGGVNFSNLKVVMREAIEGKAAVTLNYGAFIQTIFDFAIVAAAIFAAIKAVNRLKREPAPTPVPAVPTDEVKLLTEIRDALRETQTAVNPGSSSALAPRSP